MSNQNKAKRAAGEAAAKLVRDGMDIGLGTGSTTSYAIAAIGRRIREENLRLWGVPTSYQAERMAQEHGIPLTSFDEVERLDVAIDGADEVDPDLNLIKGRGGAHTREKVVASQADRFVVLVDPSKLVDQLGSKVAVPIEVVPMASATVIRKLHSMGAQPELRIAQKKDGPVVTDQGFWIVDARFGAIEDLEELNRSLHSIPGVLDHGLFLGLTTNVLIGKEDGTVEKREATELSSSVS